MSTRGSCAGGVRLQRSTLLNQPFNGWLRTDLSKGGSASEPSPGIPDGATAVASIVDLADATAEAMGLGEGEMAAMEMALAAAEAEAEDEV